MKSQSLRDFEELELLMEEKRSVRPDFGGITEDRGKRRKKFYVITAFRKQVLYKQYVFLLSFISSFPEYHLADEKHSS